MNDLEGWLEEIGCAKYLDAFRANDVTPDLVTELTDADLRELGLTLGDRKRFLRAVAALGAPAPAAAPEEVEAAAGAAHHAERRRLTVMFIDLVGSTALSARLDPEEWSEILKAYQDAVAGVVTRFGGHIAQYLGDGVLCYFGWPRAREDAAERSVEAGLEAIRSISHLRAGDEAVECRIGIATGLVVVGELIGRSTGNDEVAIGGTMNFAARLQGFAKPGQIVISDTTRELLGDAFVLEPLGERSFKGIAEKRAIYAVIRGNPAHERFHAREGAMRGAIVERETELSLLAARWRAAKAGEGQVVMLVGEAGIGKSRISHAFVSRIEGEDHTRILLQCSPYLSDTALWPVTNFLVHQAGFETGDDGPTRFAKLAALLATDEGADRAAVAVIAALLDIPAPEDYPRPPASPSARRAAYLEALTEFVIRRAARHPLLLRVEDAHWIDPTTLEALSMVADRMEDRRIMMLVTSRPDEQPVITRRPYVTSIALNRLGREGVSEIVRRLGGADLPAATINKIIDRADGVPLFAEELTKVMIERGDMSVPESLHDTLMARLDRMPGVKEVAQTASVFGREFSRAPLARVTHAPQARLDAALEDLRKVELVFPREGSDERFIFKHALVRDAAYESLLKRRREEIHGRILDALKEDRNTRAGVLAYHAAEAGRVDEAIRHGRRAADEALDRPAYAEAITQLERTLALIARSELNEERRRERKALLLLLGQAQIAHFGYAAEATLRTYAEMERIARDAGDDELLIEGLYGRWAGSYVPGKTREALAIADKVCEVSAAVGDDHAQALGYRLRGTVLTMMGQVGAATEALDRSREFYDAERHRPHASRFGQDVGVAGDCYRLGLLTLEGRFDTATKLTRKALADLEAIDHAHTTGYTLGHIACFLCAAGIEPLGTEVARKCVEVSRRDSMPLWSALGQASLAMARATEDPPEAVAPAFKAALDDLAAVDFGVFRTLYLPSYALVLARGGDPTGAAAELAEARELMEQNGTTFFEAEIRRTEGRLALLKDARLQAEAHFDHALGCARDNGHLAWELRAALDLDALYKATGRAAKGRALLAEVYARFDEGHALPPLQKAAAALSAAA